MSLKDYDAKRNFRDTPEPPGADKNGASEKRGGRAGAEFVVQKHQASHLHYDFRLAAEGVLKSWAVPKGVPTALEEKRLAILVEDHPYDYKDFEGVIPKGSYGAGTVEIWDRGVYLPTKGEDPKEFVAAGIKKGHFNFFLDGDKLRGVYSLIRLQKGAPNNWLIFKKSHAAAPEKIKPMLADAVDKSFSDPDWLFEIKWDGYRAVAEVVDGRAEIYSRNLLSFSDRFPSLVDSLRKIDTNVVIDGEIVVLDEDGKSHFPLLQKYLRSGAGNPIYYVFDILYREGENLTALPLVERKSILRAALPQLPDIKYCEDIEDDGERFFAAAVKSGLEGIIGKRKTSPYRPGVRNKDWVKIRNRLAMEAVIAGYTAPEGSRTFFGALVLGAHTQGGLRYIGRVGTGFSDRVLKDLGALLEKKRITSTAFKETPSAERKAQWVKPELVAQVEFNGWTEDGLLRQPVFLGLREDKAAADVRIETPGEPPDEQKKFPRKKKGSVLMIEKREVPISNPEKIYWPEDNYRKMDVINYYERISDTILPYLTDRPQTLHRFPDGITGERFYQKDAAELNLPDWVETVDVRSESLGKSTKYILCQNKASLIYLANLGCIEMHPWNSTKTSPENPDYSIIDLDPEGTSFDSVITVAIALRAVLEEFGIIGFPKTSGATGIHVYIPLGKKYTYGEARLFAEIVATLINKKLPEITSLERSPQKRKGKVYPDYLQNIRGKTVAAAYSLRPEPRAPVSTPLLWDEIKPGLTPESFNIETVFSRLEEYGDLFSGVLGPGVDLEKIIERFS